MELNHTPGPWVAEPETGIVFDRDGKAVQTGGAGCSIETQKNAVIMAAAPEMLAALQALMLHDPHDLNDSRPCATCNLVMAALDKARNYEPHPSDCKCRTCKHKR